MVVTRPVPTPALQGFPNGALQNQWETQGILAEFKTVVPTEI